MQIFTTIDKFTVFLFNSLKTQKQFSTVMSDRTVVLENI